MRRTGTIYLDRSLKYYRRGVGRVEHNCWRGEIQVEGKKFRCRSANRGQVEAWLDSMLEKYPEYTPKRHGKTIPKRQ